MFKQGKAGHDRAGQGKALQNRACPGMARQGRAENRVGQGRELGRVGHTSSEFIDGNGILDVLQGQCPVAPNNPWMNESCSSKDIETCCRQEQARTIFET